MKKFKEWFENLSPKAKKTVIYTAAIAAILVFGLNSYKSRQPAPSAPEKMKAVELDKDLLQKTELAENRRKVDALGTALEKLQKEQKELNERYNNESKDVTAKKTPAPGSGTDDTLPKIPDSSEVERGRIPLPPGQLPVPLAPGVTPDGSNAPVQNAGGPAQNSRQRNDKKTIGEITVVSNPAIKKGEQQKKERTVYLPPSFMSAILLTGLDAATSNNGKSNPDPVLLRVQTPAVLPNDVKANLAGCFVVGEGQGRLDKERVDVRLISLSCLSNEGNAVIDSQIKGFVTDADAKTGLAGHVVSRMGASAARALIAGIFTGAGDMMKAESTTVSTSGLGSVSTVDPSKIGSYALGNGLSAGSQRLAEFYLTLAKQATPVVEANADKHVTVVISEGKELVIKDLKRDDDDLINEEI